MNEVTGEVKPPECLQVDSQAGWNLGKVHLLPFSKEAAPLPCDEGCFPCCTC